MKLKRVRGFEIGLFLRFGFLNKEKEELVKNKDVF